MYLKQLEVGMMQNFNYLIGDPETRECAWIDPAWEVDRLLRIAKEDGYQIKKILLTHNHFDHIDGVEDLVRATNAEIYIHPLDQAPVKKSGHRIVPVKNGMEFKIGNLKVKALHTPGHTPGSACYLVEDLHLITGDTLFQGSCGRSDLPGGNPRVLCETLRTLRGLEPSTQVYPGHDYGIKPVTTIGYEKEHNPTLQERFLSSLQA